MSFQLAALLVALVVAVNLIRFLGIHAADVWTRLAGSSQAAAPAPTGPEVHCSDIAYFQPGDQGAYDSPHHVNRVNARYTGLVHEGGSYYALIDYQNGTTRRQDRVTLSKLLDKFFNESLAQRREAGQDHDRYTLQMEAVLAKAAVTPNALVQALMDDTDMDEEQATNAARSAVSRLSS